MTKFTSTNHASASTDDKVATETVAGVKGYLTPDQIGVRALAATKATDAQARALTSTTTTLTPANLAARAMFSANKGGSAQASIEPNTPTKLTFGTELHDVGGYFASSTWTPPAGPIRLNASIFASAGVTVTTLSILYIYKNGSAFKQFLTYSPVSGMIGMSISANDVANGTDTYEVWVYLPSGTTSTVDGAAAYTYFEGEQI